MTRNNPWSSSRASKLNYQLQLVLSISLSLFRSSSRAAADGGTLLESRCFRVVSDEGQRVLPPSTISSVFLRARTQAGISVAQSRSSSSAIDRRQSLSTHIFYLSTLCQTRNRLSLALNNPLTRTRSEIVAIQLESYQRQERLEAAELN